MVTLKIVDEIVMVLQSKIKVTNDKDYIRGTVKR